MGNSSRSVVTADMTRDAWISSTRWFWGRPRVPAMMMAGVTQPTIMDTRCCSAMDTVSPSGGMPRNRNNASRLGFIFCIGALPVGLLT